MGAKMTARLCAASVVAGAVIAPPTIRAVKRQTSKAVHKAAHGYVKVRHQFGKMAEATGRPGEFAGMFAAFTAQAARDTTNKWWQVVAEAEKEEEQARKTHEAELKTAGPPETIDDYMGNRQVGAAD